MDCPVCLSEIPLDDVVFIEPCGHAFCRACVRAAGAAAAGAGVSTVRCPESECEATVSPAALASLLDQRTVLQLERNSVPAALGAALSWCRTPDCSNCVEHEGVPAEFFCTACGHRRCVLCGAEPYHHGRSCAEASAPGAPEPALAPAPIPGAVIPATEPGMAEYLATHTRVCRRCQQAVEKASGVSQTAFVTTRACRPKPLLATAVLKDDVSMRISLLLRLWY